MPISTDILSYYTQHSLMTDPGEYSDLFMDLPGDIPGLTRIVQGLLLHPFCTHLYNVQLSPKQREEVHLRSIPQMLARIREIDPAPLTVAREPVQRLIGNCRDHAVLFTALLRHQGIPARLRVGFASYLSPRKNEDHWVTEYWNTEQKCWVLVDPQIDDIQRKAMHIDFDTLDMQYCKHFYLGGHSWQLCRNGEEKSANFGFKKWKGWQYIRQNLLLDLTALNKIELIPWDRWGTLMTKPERDVTPEDKALLDRLARITINADAHFDELQTTYEEMPYSNEVSSRLGLLGLTDAVTITDPQNLHPADSERLASLREDTGSASPELTPQPPLLQREGEKAEIPPARSNPLSSQERGLEGEFSLMQNNTSPPHTKPFQGKLVPVDLQTVAAMTALGAPPIPGDIVIYGARQHNLKNIDVTIPRHRFVVVTGVSGSGKSSLAFDTLYAEGQRRYVESLSSYARQFLGQMEKPKVDHITGLAPAIAIEQKTVSKNPRSTVGTVTEVLDYLRVLYARAGTPHCPQCGRGVQSQSPFEIVKQLVALSPGTRLQLLAPIVRRRKGTHVDLLKQVRRDGYIRARIDGELVDLTAEQEIPKLAKTKAHTIELIVDRVKVPEENPEQNETFQSRLIDSVETTLKAGNGLLIVLLDNGEEILLSEHHACPHCDLSFPELTPQLFSFNSPTGMCPDCNGLGVTLRIDPNLIVTKPHLSLLDGASPWYGNMRQKKGNWHHSGLASIATHYKADLELPWNQLPQKFRDVLLYGSGEERIRFTHKAEWDEGSWKGESVRTVKGVVHNINRLFRQTKSEYRRRYFMQFMSNQPCQTCNGERLCPEARFTTVGDLRLPEVTSMTIAQAQQWMSGLPEKLGVDQLEFAEEVIKELQSRLQFMLNVGLHYLTLDRAAPTLSGGEGQRIRLASQLGCGLSGVLYVLDEPSIGLHTRDHRALIKTLTQLRDMGNTVLVIEHDADTMRQADWLIDLGPGAGEFGGGLVAVGTPKAVAANPESLTGRYLSGELHVTAPNGEHRRKPQGWLTITGARLHNLKAIKAQFPVGVMTCVTGVSGSGKSSLVAKTLFPALSQALHGAQTVPGPHDRLDGLEQVDKIINITQSPIGRTPRSNPGTYVKVFDEIRKVFAAAPEARSRGYKPGRFSFNVKGGCCEECRGHGVKRIEMHFLADVWVTCKACGGSRFNHQTLEVKFKGKSIADVLDMDVQEALVFFENHPKIKRILQTLHDVGLDYIKLGQSALTLSGGEAQRVKLAKELSRVNTGRTIYILDEPTTGLHFADIQRLLDVLHRLTDAGNSVIIIEHNLDVIKTADWLIDLGPEGGDDGGSIVAQGAPEDVVQIAESYTGQFLRQVL